MLENTLSFRMLAWLGCRKCRAEPPRGGSLTCFRFLCFLSCLALQVWTAVECRQDNVRVVAWSLAERFKREEMEIYVIMRRWKYEYLYGTKSLLFSLTVWGLVVVYHLNICQCILKQTIYFKVGIVWLHHSTELPKCLCVQYKVNLPHKQHATLNLK